MLLCEFTEKKKNKKQRKRVFPSMGWRRGWRGRVEGVGCGVWLQSSVRGALVHLNGGRGGACPVPGGVIATSFTHSCGLIRIGFLYIFIISSTYFCFLFFSAVVEGCAVRVRVHAYLRLSSSIATDGQLGSGQRERVYVYRYICVNRACVCVCARRGCIAGRQIERERKRRREKAQTLLGFRNTRTNTISVPYCWGRRQ